MRCDYGNRIADRRWIDGVEVTVDLARERVRVRRVPRSGNCGTTEERLAARTRMVAFGMPDRLTRADVDRIATLARLELSDEEKNLFVQQLSHILEYAEQIQQIDTTGVEPTSQVLSRMPSDRPDEPSNGLATENALANAPDAATDGRLFRVPRVIG